ncbi:hypothetical protein GUITHDRAFT_162531, partial [Guillardia theta CCMP2712]
MLARAVGRLRKTSNGISVCQGICHPPLAAKTPHSPRYWSDQEVEASQDPLPLFVFCHATSFCKEIWQPFVDELQKLSREPFRWVSFDFSCHGDSRAEADANHWKDWKVAKEDVCSVLKEFRGDCNKIVGVGHSMGATSLVLAELENPGMFATLQLMEPVIFPHPESSNRPDAITEGLKRSAMKRRSEWSSFEELEQYMQTREAFKKFDSRAMKAYIHGGFRQTEDDKLTLKCQPQHEVNVYAGRPNSEEMKLDQVNCPVNILA